MLGWFSGKVGRFWSCSIGLVGVRFVWVWSTAYLEPACSKQMQNLFKGQLGLVKGVYLI